MNVAIFGGTFDPIHRGHLALAQAARERFHLGRIYFVPADIPPHKQKHPLSSYYDRYAMVSLATAGEKAFAPSLIEAPGTAGSGRPNYSLETVRKFRAGLKAGDRLFFLIGMDAFLDIGKWYRAEDLLQEVEFIVGSRPGFSLAKVESALPEALRSRVPAGAARDKSGGGKLAFGRVAIYLLPEVAVKVSATQVRAAAALGAPLKRMVPEEVAGYIQKTGLYQTGDKPGGKQATGKRAGVRRK
jgi:nicotinate-nucleotide adenylyltransferase